MLKREIWRHGGWFDEVFCLKVLNMFKVTRCQLYKASLVKSWRVPVGCWLVFLGPRRHWRFWFEFWCYYKVRYWDVYVDHAWYLLYQPPRLLQSFLMSCIYILKTTRRTLGELFQSSTVNCQAHFCKRVCWAWGLDCIDMDSPFSTPGCCCIDTTAAVSQFVL